VVSGIRNPIRDGIFFVLGAGDDVLAGLARTGAT
jgi:hypothetical protein